LFDRIIERGRYPEAAARDVMRMLLRAVQYLHDNGIVHRDLKPENILLVDHSLTSQVKITDFGLAKRASREGLKTFCGTPQYFAPEVLGRRAEGVPAAGAAPPPGARYGYKADMWSLGVVLFIMLSGAFPFDEAKYSLSGPQWSTVSSDAKRFVRALMTLDPLDRLDVRQALQHEWMRAEASTDLIRSDSGTRRVSSQRKVGDYCSTAKGGYRDSAKSSPHSIVSEPGQVDSAPPLSVTCSVAPAVSSAEDGGQATTALPVRKKTFCPVFWSARRQISATLSGSIPCGGPMATNSQVRAAAGPLLATVVPAGGVKCADRLASGGGAIGSWYEPVECCEGDDDIDEFSSDDEASTVSKEAPRILGRSGGVSDAQLTIVMWCSDFVAY
ncbi:Camk4, partial [Symbiodinium microadriaticum]